MQPDSMDSGTEVQDPLGMKPFVVNHRAARQSLADVSFLVDGPAGKDGFIRIRGSHFVKPDGKRIKFWGVHLTDWSAGSVQFPPKEDVPMWADALARHGVNLVRFHFTDLWAPRGIIDNTRNDSQHFDAQQLDRMDYLVSELKKRGIYIDMNLNVGRSYKAGDGVPDAARIGWAKGLVYFNLRLIELQKDYARKFLTRMNPYTGVEYRNEPAIAIVELVNENALYMGFRAPTPYYENELTMLYNRWLARKLGSKGLERFREVSGVEKGALVPRLQGAAINAASKERYETELAFYRETEANYYKDMRDFLRKDLGIRQPITGTADHSHTSSPYTMLTSLKLLDIIDGHDYWQHPGSRVMGTPMVNDPENSTISELARTAIAGMPYTVSETNHPFPNDYASEGIPILAAYGCLQDWDMIVMYTFEPKRDPAWKPYVTDPFDISHDPVKMSELAAGALMFLRGDVRAARKTIERTYSAEQVIASRKLPGSEAPFFTPGYPAVHSLMHKVRIKSLDGPPTASYAPVKDNPIVSDTGQLKWFRSKTEGVVTVDTDRSQALIGFLKPGSHALKNLSADLKNVFATVWLTSMEDKPISTASRLLLTTGSKVANTGMVLNANGRGNANQGGSPTLIEPVTGTVTLRGLRGAKSVVAIPLDGSGNAIGSGIAATESGADWVVAIGDPVTCWYQVRVGR